MKVFIKQSKDDILHNKIWKCFLNKVRMIYYITNMKVFIKQSKDDILHNKIWKCLLNKVRMIYYITKYESVF